MDIYQVWITYNKKWSKYEILAFSVLLFLTVIVVAGCVCRKKINLIQAVAFIGLLAFLLGVCVTVLCFRIRQLSRECAQDKESEIGRASCRERV